MSGSFVQDFEDGREVLRISGTFDLECAWSLRKVVERSAASEIVLDFLHVREFVDLGLAVLASGLALLRRRVVVRGLGHNQEKILRYCGLSIDEPTRSEPKADAHPN